MCGMHFDKHLSDRTFLSSFVTPFYLSCVDVQSDVAAPSAELSHWLAGKYRPYGRYLPLLPPRYGAEVSGTAAGLEPSPRAAGHAATYVVDVRRR